MIFLADYTGQGDGLKEIAEKTGATFVASFLPVAGKKTVIVEEKEYAVRALSETVPVIRLEYDPEDDYNRIGEALLVPLTLTILIVDKVIILPPCVPELAMFLGHALRHYLDREQPATIFLVPELEEMREVC
jgi:hypothetical protein